MMDTLKMDIDALLGERWFPKETSFEEDITEYWGEWGVCSEVETLRAVLMRRPGKEVESFDPKAVRFSDEPIDVELMRRLSEGGNTVVVIEHNLDVIKTADYIIDIGPEGGDGGGTVIACGTPEEVAKSPVSYTGKYVEKYL